jgi:hypothetical protein
MRPYGNGTTTRSRVARLALALIMGGMLLTLSLGAGVASASGGRGHGDAEATFTKWVTDWPNMAGIVGEDVGKGTFAGKVLDYNPGPTTVIAATYQFNGARHSFTALVHVEQTGLRAVIVGVVTDGWGKGSLVEGGYTQITCAHDGITTTCFRGELDIVRD